MEGPDEGDDGEGEEDGEDGDDGDSDDPPGNQNPRAQIPEPTDDREYWDGFDHDDEEDDCWGPRETEAPTSSVTATPDPCAAIIDAVACDVDGPTDGPEPVSEPADANCDGGVDGSDALAVLSFASGAGEGCTGNSGSGDADCSGDVNAGDAVAILGRTAGIAASGC
jgi:hypothetical protein